MNLYQSIAGKMRLRVTSADRISLLTSLTKQGISVDNIQDAGDLQILITVKQSDYGAVSDIIRRRGDLLRIEKKIGIYWRLEKLYKRPAFIFLILFFVFCALWLPERIFFVTVEGNSSVPEKLIVEQAEKCGIVFGASRRDVRSEKVKNELISRIPQLQWVGVNTVGCSAVITVRERSEAEQDSMKNQITSIIAARDCIIRNITVEKGQAACQVGQAVEKGQTLISGITDCGLKLTACRSQGEIYGETSHVLCMVSPMPKYQRGEKTGSHVDHALQIGKKVINFHNTSRNSNGLCVKIYKKKFVYLPGGFRLPIAWISRQYDTYAPARENHTFSGSLLADYGRRYLAEHMIAGQILDEKTVAGQENDLFTLTGRYGCLESVGYERTEEAVIHGG